MQIARPKQYLNIHGKPVLEHTLARLMAVQALSGIVVAVSPTDPEWEAFHAHLRRTWPESWLGRLHTVRGGAERVHSVYNALTHLRKLCPESTRVMVHDAVRPCVRISDVHRLIEAVGEQADGGLLAMPVADTLKRAAADGRIDETVDRTALWRACTPQLFPLGTLWRALDEALKAGRLVTDEASAMEMAGFHPLLVPCQADNLKLTHPQDLSLIECLLPHTEETPCA